jgi:hypothetical protein
MAKTHEKSLSDANHAMKFPDEAFGTRFAPLPNCPIMGNSFVSSRPALPF